MRTHATSNVFGVVAGSVLLVLAVAQTGCGKEQSPDELRVCATNTWVHTEHACMCPAGSRLNTPECAAQDCRQSSVMALRADGTSLDLILRRSTTMSQLSVIGGPAGIVRGSWTIQPGSKLRQQFAYRSFESTVECNELELNRPSIEKYHVAPPALVAAIVRAEKNGSWTSVSFQTQ